MIDHDTRDDCTFCHDGIGDVCEACGLAACGDAACNRDHAAQCNGPDVED
jgi:hypothetical protein